MFVASKKTINPHLKLHVLSLPPLDQQSETPLQRLNLLAQTRRFEDIKAAAASIKDMSFPTLPNSSFWVS
jgi:hypothetical protein